MDQCARKEGGKRRLAVARGGARLAEGIRERVRDAMGAGSGRWCQERVQWAMGLGRLVDDVGVILGGGVEAALGAAVGIYLGTDVDYTLGAAVGITLGAAVGTTHGSTVGTTLGAAVGTTLRAGAGVGITVGAAHGAEAGVGVLVGGSMGWEVVALVALHFPNSAWMLEMASSLALYVIAGWSARAQERMERAWVM